MNTTLPFGPGVREIAAHPSGLFALEKPAGVLSHPNGRTVDAGALLLAPYDAESERYLVADPAGGAVRSVWLLNRLDSPTSGVVLLSTDPGTAETVRALFSGREVGKTYHAVVKGAPLPPSGVWDAPLAKRRLDSGRHVRAGGGPGAISAITRYARVAVSRVSPPLALVTFSPETGRTHQLRIHATMYGHPIVGDKTYGDFSLNRFFAARAAEFDRLFLHCSRTEFRYAFGGREHNFIAESPLPAVFKKILGDDGLARAGSREIRIKPKR